MVRTAFGRRAVAGQWPDWTRPDRMLPDWTKPDTARPWMGAMTPDEPDPAPDDEPSAERRVAGLRTGRMESFSDGVFAIAVTLLVLEIAIPTGRGEDLLSAVVEQWPTYVAYLVSFFTIGAVWIAHSTITDYLERADPLLLRINLVLLLVVSFLPVPTRLLAEYLNSEAGERVAVTIYGLTLLAIRLTVMALWRYSESRGLLRADLADEDVRSLDQKLAPSMVAYVAALVVGLLLPIVAVVLYLLVSLYLVIPFASIAAVLRRRHAST